MTVDPHFIVIYRCWKSENDYHIWRRWFNQLTCVTWRNNVLRDSVIIAVVVLYMQWLCCCCIGAIANNATQMTQPIMLHPTFLREGMKVCVMFTRHSWRSMTAKSSTYLNGDVFFPQRMWNGTRITTSRLNQRYRPTWRVGLVVIHLFYMILMAMASDRVITRNKTAKVSDWRTGYISEG